MEENQIINQTQSAHDDFDWSVDKRNVASYSQEKREQLEKVYDSTFKTIDEAELIKPIIIECMRTALPLPNGVPVEAEIGGGVNWLEAH